MCRIESQKVRKMIGYPGSLAGRTMDEIDRVLALHYGFIAEELDLIINCDIKYRMGASDTEDDDGT